MNGEFFSETTLIRRGSAEEARKTDYTDSEMRETLYTHGTERFPFHCYLTRGRAGADGQAHWDWFWHWHSDLEWLCVREGTVRLLTGEGTHTLHTGEGIFVNSGTIHTVEAEDTFAYHLLTFRPEVIAPVSSPVYQRYLLPVLRSQSACIVLRPQEPWQADILSRIAGICKTCRAGGPTLELWVIAQLCELWRSLIIGGGERLFAARSERELQTQERLHRMMQFIWAHYAEHITLEDIAAAANISKSSALRCFQTGIQSTPVQYLNTYRLQRAKELLSSTGRSVSEVALAVGFDNVGYFDRLFKRENGVTPKAFRQEGHSPCPPGVDLTAQ